LCHNGSLKVDREGARELHTPCQRGAVAPHNVQSIENRLLRLNRDPYFEFSLTVGPDGMRFAVSAPDEARDVIIAVFGIAEPAPVGCDANGDPRRAACRCWTPTR
jgi:hypothetical protein